MQWHQGRGESSSFGFADAGSRGSAEHEVSVHEDADEERRDGVPVDAFPW
jgi:hypothetical protein